LTDYDSIIIGGGHNGLVCAAYLAKSGQRVLVLEAADRPGGLGANREFCPGFMAPVAHSTSHFPRKVVDDLNLAARGYTAGTGIMPTIGLGDGESPVTLHEGTLTGASDRDVEAYQDYSRLMHRFADALAPFWMKTMPRIGGNSVSDMMTFAHMGLSIRRMGKKDMREFLRVVSLPVRDLMDEYFEGDTVKTMLGWDGLIGSKLAPRSPNSSVLVMLYRMCGGARGAHCVPGGGIGALIDALSGSAAAFGAEVRCSVEVSKILVDADADGLVANGVRLANGETIGADRVISSVDPKRTFLSLLGVEYLDIGFTNKVRRLRCEGLVGKLHLALDSAPEFRNHDQANGRMIIAPDLDAIEFAYDDAKYGACSKNPVMELVVPSVHDASLAPDGKHVLSAHVMYIPYRLRGTWTDDDRNAACETAIDVIARHAPGIRESIVGAEFLTPWDIERQHHVTGGHWHHTEFAMDQLLMMRPTYGAAQYATPIPGLYLCGAGSHPGGDITGAPGHNAAHEVLR
jgi:phytoene dehydrogenase-like protein